MYGRMPVTPRTPDQGLAKWQDLPKSQPKSNPIRTCPTREWGLEYGNAAN